MNTRMSNAERARITTCWLLGETAETIAAAVKRSRRSVLGHIEAATEADPSLRATRLQHTHPGIGWATDREVAAARGISRQAVISARATAGLPGGGDAPAPGRALDGARAARSGLLAA